MGTSFGEKLERAVEAHRSLLCVGLDPDPALMPLPDVSAFLRSVVEATADLVCAYKVNLGFYEALGRSGLDALEEVLKAIPSEVPVIGDGKRGDVLPTARFYARALFEVWGFDAVTVNPYAGHDSVEPFLEYRERGVFLWCRSSNPGAREFQDLVMADPYSRDARPLYEWVAVQAVAWDRYGNLGLVVGATYPEELGRVRALCPRMPLLVPGIGAQGGDIGRVVRQGVDERGRGLILTASRAVLYASRDPEKFGEAARQSALALRDRVRRELAALGRPGDRR